MAQKPSIPKGTRDFLPQDVLKRNYIFDTIKKSFKIYGFSPIETPSFELLNTLTGKYGDEGDRLIFKILNSGEKVKKLNLRALEEGNLSKFSNSLSEKALRYDLTVPFTRFVAQHQNEINFPFKRYQIQPVWRADRPQYGRYQEFYQCDADVVGSRSLLYEVDFIILFDEVLTNLNIPDFTIKLNNRKILSGIVEICGESDKLIPITVAIDKFDKIGIEGVVKELRENGVSDSSIEKIKSLFIIDGDTISRLSKMKVFLNESEIGIKGVEELEFILNHINALGLKRAHLEFDMTLARGLNYYTGAIFEVKVNSVKMGSICGGGRYDNLTNSFGLNNISGIGISFGADRIYDVLNELNLFPNEIDNNLELLFLNFGELEESYCLKLIRKVRSAGISCDLYPSSAKLKKQMKYANDIGVKNIVIVGQNEINESCVQIKNMETGNQEKMTIDQLIIRLKK